MKYVACNVLIGGTKEEKQKYIEDVQKYTAARIATSLQSLQILLGRGYYVIIDEDSVRKKLDLIIKVAKSNNVPIIGVNFNSGDLEIDRTDFNRYYLMEGIYGDN